MINYKHKFAVQWRHNSSPLSNFGKTELLHKWLEIADWLSDDLVKGEDWSTDGPESVYFYFKNEQDALAFKLKYGY